MLTIRKKSARFRSWLANEADRDRDAIIAYHNEIGAELGIISAGRKVLRIFGVLGGGSLGGVIGASVAGPVGGALGGVVGSATGYLADLTASIGADWTSHFRQLVEPEN